MKSFPVQYHRFSKTTMGDNLITFRVDALYSKDVSELIAKNIGTEFMCTLVEADVNLPEAEQGIDVKEKFWRKMHSLINDYAEIKGVSTEEAKTELKGQLIQLGLIKESTKELGIKGLSQACSILQDLIQEHGG